MRNLNSNADELFAELSMEDLSDIPDARGGVQKTTSTYPTQNMDRTMLNIK